MDSRNTYVVRICL